MRMAPYTLNDPKYCTARRHLTPPSVVIRTAPRTRKRVLLFPTVILCYFALIISFLFFFFLFARSLSIDWMCERRKMYRHNINISLCAHYKIMASFGKRNSIRSSKVAWHTRVVAEIKKNWSTTRPAASSGEVRVTYARACINCAEITFLP